MLKNVDAKWLVEMVLLMGKFENIESTAIFCGRVSPKTTTSGLTVLLLHKLKAKMLIHLLRWAKRSGFLFLFFFLLFVIINVFSTFLVLVPDS